MGYILENPLAAEWYSRILNSLKIKLSEAGIIGIKAEITKHYLLSTLEIYLSYDSKTFLHEENFDELFSPNKKIHDKTVNIKQYVKGARALSIGMYHLCARYNGVDTKLLTRVVNDLIEDKELSLSTMPCFIRYRLTECCYALEYSDPPLGFYRELVSLGVISCGKYSYNIDRNVKGNDAVLSLLSIRAGLIFEFKMQQRSQSVMMQSQKADRISFPIPDSTTSRTERKRIADNYKRLIDISVLEDKINFSAIFQCKEHVSKLHVERLLKNMSRYYFHNRMFNGTQGGWLGTLGAYAIEIGKIANPKKAIYYSVDNSNTISEKTKEAFVMSGFSVSSRSLYLRHKDIKKAVYPKIKYYAERLVDRRRIIPWHLEKHEEYEEALRWEEPVGNMEK